MLKRSLTFDVLGQVGPIWQCAAITIVLSFVLANSLYAGKPGYEAAYYNGSTVIINAIDVKQNPTTRAQADFYEVVYPSNWQALGLPTPQCHPCDHEGNGIDFTDFHDHILDSIPSSPGHGEYSPLWHVFLILPLCDPALGGSGCTAGAGTYASHLPVKSEADAEALADMGLGMEVDTGFYFICAVVSANAGKLEASVLKETPLHPFTATVPWRDEVELVSTAWRPDLLTTRIKRSWEFS
jgi:hypothetical protein